MKTQIWPGIVLMVSLLCPLNSTAVAGPCGLELGDRVELVVDHPDGHPTLWKGMRGTVICFDTWGLWQPVLVSWDGWTEGHDNIWFCTTYVLSHLSGSCWWVYCYEIESLPEGVPDLFDAGEQERYFEPQVLLAGEPFQQFEVGMEVENGGTGDPPETVYVDVYASRDNVITKSDYYIGSTNCWISAGGSVNLKMRKNFPTNIPPGLYRIGWIIDPDNVIPNEYDETNNVACLTSYRLTVLGRPGRPALTVSAATGGEITSPGEGVFVYSGTTSVTMVASADSDCTFLGWTGSAVEAGKVTDASAAQTNVTVDAPYTLRALFNGPHLLVEDFESYADPDNPLNRAWVDGLGYLPGEAQGKRGNGTGSIIGYAEMPTPGNPTVHGGAESMLFSYRNVQDPWYSEAERRWGTLQNWAMTGADALSIWYRGAAGNSAAPLYVALEDCYEVAGVAEHVDPQAVRVGEWRNWTVPLVLFEDAGVMLSRIVKIHLGVGNRNERQAGGEGTLYFDDITLVYRGIDMPSAVGGPTPQPPAMDRPIITSVIRANGESDFRAPIGQYYGNTAPLPTEAGGLRDGNLCFSDRTYPWVWTPTALVGAEYIRLFNSDKKSATVTYMVTTSREATLAIAVDDRIIDQQGAVDTVTAAFVPARTFRDTGLDLFIHEDAATDRRMSVFSATVPAGTHVFRAMQSVHNFYTIIAMD